MSRNFRRYILETVRIARNEGDISVARLMLHEYFFDVWKERG